MRPNNIRGGDVWQSRREDVYLALARITGIHDTMVSRRDIEDEILNFEHIYESLIGCSQYQRRQSITHAMKSKNYPLLAPGTINKVWIIGATQ